MTETVNKIPGLSSLPLVGKIFTSHSKNKNNTELLVLVTPQPVIEPGQSLPDLARPVEPMPPLPAEFEHQKQHRRPEETAPKVPVSPSHP